MWNTKNTKPTCILWCVLMCYLSTFAQSPPNLPSDFAWNSSTTGTSSSAATVVSIQNAFNNGRRQEEILKTLPTNALGNLVLPTDFLTYSKAQKILLLLNAERNCRAGVDYDGAGGVPPVLGLSVDGVDAALTTVAQNHADWLLTNNKFQHTGAGNTTPFERIQATYGLNTCSEFLASGENIYLTLSSSTTITGTAEKAIYNWIYKDSGSNWGHREAALLQDKDLATNNSTYGYKNNYGSGTAEGMIGVGFVGANGGTYNPFNSSPIDRAEAIVMVVMDPVSTSLSTTNNCNFAVAASLPITLLSFDVEQHGNAAFLKWETATERNSDYFVVEKAIANGEFETIGRVEAFGNSLTKRSYFFEDKNLKNGVYYYRIVNIDEDGKKQNSNLSVLKVINTLDFTVYTAFDKINIALLAENNDNIKVEILDINGRVVEQFEETISNGANQILRSLDIFTGIYFMKISQNGVNKVMKFSYVR